MNATIVKIFDRGIVNKECLAIKISANTDLKYFLVLSTKYATPESLNPKPVATFWFGPKLVKTGDFIFLYTGTGNASQSLSKDGLSTNYFFYWNQPKTLWNNTGDCAVLFEVNSWETSKYE